MVTCSEDSWDGADAPVAVRWLLSGPMSPRRLLIGCPTVLG